MVPKGKFIAFCGGEGAGKSTQIELLAAHLRRRGRDVLTTREPGGTPEGQQLRRLLLTPDGDGWEPMAETLLMVADRVQHLRRVIAPALEAGTDVLCDRYALSTLSYQGAGKGVAASFIRELHRQACDDFWPDLTIVLDIPPAVGLARSKRRLSKEKSDEDRFERLRLDFHDRVRTAFLDHVRKNPETSFLVDATQDISAIHDAIRGRVDALFEA